MARFRVFDTETAELLVPRLANNDEVDLCTTGEYFSADPGELILAPSVRNGEVLYIKIRSAAPAPEQERQPVSEPIPKTDFAPKEPTSSPVATQPPPPDQPSRHYVGGGFLGLDGDLEEESAPEPPKPWWKRLID